MSKADSEGEKDPPAFHHRIVSVKKIPGYAVFRKISETER